MMRVFDFFKIVIVCGFIVINKYIWMLWLGSLYLFFWKFKLFVWVFKNIFDLFGVIVFEFLKIILCEIKLLFFII